MKKGGKSVVKDGDMTHNQCVSLVNEVTDRVITKIALVVQQNLNVWEENYSEKLYQSNLPVLSIQSKIGEKAVLERQVKSILTATDDSTGNQILEHKEFVELLADNHLKIGNRNQAKRE
jgi:uncharacterized HAD superfamily protein